MLSREVLFMLKNNFITNTQKKNNPKFSGRFKLLLIIAIFYTGPPSIFSLIGFIFSPWAEFGTASFSMLVYLLCELCIFISLIRIFINKIPFLKIVSQCIWVISILLLSSSLIITRLSDYQSRGFDILAEGGFVLIDGHLFLSGILAVILACLIKEGAKMQTELDEIL